jgi:hypothetical protein
MLLVKAHQHRPFHLATQLYVSGGYANENEKLLNAPQKIHLRDSWSKTFWSVAGSVSVSIFLLVEVYTRELGRESIEYL